MELLLLVAAYLLASVVLGFVLNRFVLRRIARGRTKAFALAASRAIFYAPSIIGVGHGGPIPFPLLMVPVLSYRGAHPTVDLMTFLLPGIVFLGSLAVAWSRRFGLLFFALLGAHVVVFGILPFALTWAPSNSPRVLPRAGAFPWYLMQYLFDLPDIEIDWLMMPRQTGWQLWCVGVWLALYTTIAMVLARLTAHSSRPRMSSARGA